MANRNNGLSLVAKLNIALSEQAISEDLKKISETLNGKNLPSFIAHLNIKGSASAINKELQELGKKLKVDFGKIATGGSEQKMKQVGKKIAQSVFNVQELKKAGRDYIYNENDLQKQIDKLQARYDKRSISMANSVTVQAVTNEKNVVTGLVVEYQNLEKQLVKVNYEKVKFDNKKTGFAVTSSTYSDSTLGREYQKTLSFLNKIDKKMGDINNKTLGQTSPIKENTKAWNDYQAKLKNVNENINKIKGSEKVLSQQQKDEIQKIVNEFEREADIIKQSAKGANALNAKNLESSVKNANSELTTMLKVLYKNSEYSRNLGNEFHGIVGKITDLRSFLNGVTDNAGFTEYQVRLRSLKDEIRQFNADALKANNTEALKRNVSDLQGKIMAFIRENNNLSESYKKNLTDIATKAQFTNSKFELRGLTNQANALMNAKTQSDNLGRSILTLNNSLDVSEQKLLEMQNDTAGLDVEFQRVADTLNGVRTRLGTVSNKNEFKDIRISAQEAKQAVNDLYKEWQQRQITNQRLVANQTLDNISEKLQRQRNDLYGLDTEYNNYTQRVTQLQTALNNAVDRIQFNTVSADIRVLQSQLQGFYADIEGRRKTTLFSENAMVQMVRIDENARSVASNIAKDSQAMQAYEIELNRVMTEIGNITRGTEVLSDQQEMDIRRLVENFRLYETELQKATAQGFKPTLDQNIDQYFAQLETMMAKLHSMSAKVSNGMSGDFNNIRASIRGLQNQLGAVVDERGLTNFEINLRLVTEQFSQFTSAVSGQTTIDSLTNKISTLDTKMNQYLRTVTNITPAQRTMLENLRNQLNASFTIPEFESIKTQWDNLVTDINTEQQRISGIPLEERLLRLQGTLVTLRTEVQTHRTELGNLGVGYEQIIREIDQFITSTGNGTITSIDEFNTVNNEVAMLQDRIKGLNVEMSAMQRTTLFNEGIETQLNRIDANARSVSSHLAKDAQLMQAYEAEFVNVRTQIDNITNGVDILSQTQQTEVRRIVEGFKLYEAELQNVAKENLKPTLMQDMATYSAQITSMISKIDAMATKVPVAMNAQVNAFRQNLDQLRIQVGNVTSESEMTNIAVNFKLAREEFSQLTSAISEDNSLDSLINKISALDTEMDRYLRTTTNITQVQAQTINGFRNQLATAFTLPDFERISTEYSNFIKTIATEQQRIGGIPLENKLLEVQEVLVTLRTSVIAHKDEVGSLGGSYNQLIGEIDRFISSINNGAIASIDDFNMMQSGVTQLQERIKQTGIEIKRDIGFLNVNNGVRTLVSDINTYLNTNLNLPAKFRQQAEAIVYELNHTFDKLQLNELKVRWHELVNSINSEVVRINGVNLSEKINTDLQALNVLRQNIVSQKGDAQGLDDVYRGLLAELDRLRNVSQNIYSQDQYYAWINDITNLQQRVTQLKNSIKSTTEIDHLAVQSANLISKINLFIAQNSKMGEQAKQKLRELANQAQQAQSKMELTNINTQFQTFTNKLKEADKVGQSLFDRMKQNLSKFTAWFGMTTMVMRLITQIRQMIGYVKELDTAMVNLKKVTDETDQVYQRFFERAGKSAQELHANMADLISATAEFAKLGYNITESEGLAKSATVLANVGEFENIEDASTSIVSAMKAFKISANDAMTIVDKMNETANRYPISAQGVSEALRRSASALAVAGNDINESIGLIIGANAVVLIVPLDYSNIVISR